MSTECQSTKPDTLPLVSIVIIGRNEGERLVACLNSIGEINAPTFLHEVIYVDSASTDGSPRRAAELGAQVISVRPERPSAALGRNAGWQAARGDYIMFLDGDTILDRDFIRIALQSFADPAVAIVWGHRRELAPKKSIYNRVLDLDWIYPPGDSDFCGGDALVRRSVLEVVRGFDQSLIAGEEPEMCRRIRDWGWRIVHLDLPMTQHDLAIRYFSAYWRRAFRAGHAYAEIATRFQGTRDPLWQRESRRNLAHASILLFGTIFEIFLLAWGSQPALALAGFLAACAGLVLLRSTRRNAWKCGTLKTRWLYALHSHFQQIPIFCGQVVQRWHARYGRQRQLIEYK